MRKLKLKLDELSVESFEIAEKTEERGTVHGNYITQFCTGANVFPNFTCVESCGTCVGSCVNESCDTCESCGTCNSDCYMTPPSRYTAYYDELTMCVYG